MSHLADRLRLSCIHTGKDFDFDINVFNNPDTNTWYYSNLILQWWYRLDRYKSLVPFAKEHVSYGANNTPLIINEYVSKMLNIPHLLIKDESQNPYGTHKDRRSEYIVNVAIEQGVDKIVCLTAGNAWYSLSRYCSRARIDYTSLVFPWVSKERKASLWERWNVITIDGSRYNGILRPRDFKAIVEEHDQYERQKTWNKIWAVTNSFEPISVNAYKELFYEIKDEKPDYVVLPCGSGDIIVGVWLAIQELGMHTKIIAVWPKGEHPLDLALKYAKSEIQIPNYKEDSVAEKLSSPFTAVLPILYKIFYKTQHIYREVDNDLITQTRAILEKDTMIKAENSALPAFAVFIGHDRPRINPDAKVIIINTGKGLEN